MTWISGALIIWAVAIAAMDLRVRRVPNAAIAAIVLLVGGSFAIQGAGPLGLDRIATLSGAALPLLILWPAYVRRWLGGGDAKLAAAMGLLIGPLPIAMLLLIAGALLGFAGFAVRLRRPRETQLPAAPMLAAGFTAVLSLAAIA
jgi:Flp pilus assembly protein protease CpaA